MARPRPGEGSRPETPAWTRPRRVRIFDLLGVAVVAAFVAVVALDRGSLGRPRDEISLHLDPAELAAGFREGVEYHGLYRGEDKVGFLRLARRRTAAGYALTNTTVFELGIGDGPTRLTVETELDDGFRLRSFSATTRGPIEVTASGTYADGILIVSLDGPLGVQSQRLPMSEPPAFDFSLAPLAARSDLAAGDRFRFTHFDPMTMSTSEGTVQMLGRDSVDVLGEEVDAIHLRQTIAGQDLDLWVNELGEVLRQQMASGLMAIRESEAEATWGFVGHREAP
jgi:hypothetical protein